MSFSHFEPSFFAFLSELSKNNNREWFEGNKTRYKSDVQGELVRFVEAMAPRLAQISDQIDADPRTNGKTIFRIHRDVRFSRDKRPYKEAAACHFRHAGEKDVHGPGFYIHLATDRVGLGAGIWAPPPDGLLAIRRRIADRPSDWTKLKATNGIGQMLDEMETDKLKTPPRGFLKDHEHVEDLKRKSFMAARSIPTEEALKESFLDEVANFYMAAAPLNRFICDALGLKF